MGTKLSPHFTIAIGIGNITNDSYSHVRVYIHMRVYFPHKAAVLGSKVMSKKWFHNLIQYRLAILNLCL